MMMYMSVPSQFTVYPSQTKILEGGTRDEMRMFDAFFKVVSTLFGPLTIEKCIEHPHFISCSSFPNIRLGQPSATSPLFFDNLHCEHFDKPFKVDLWTLLSTLLSKCGMANKHCAISHPLLNEGTCIRQYSIRQIRHIF